MGFRGDSARYRHFRNVHEGIKDHYCGICGKSFTSYGVLKNHLKTIHSDSKDFVCDICTKAFAEKGQRKSHINIVHKGMKQYNCHLCNDRSYSTKVGMQKHI